MTTKKTLTKAEELAEVRGAVYGRTDEKLRMIAALGKIPKPDRGSSYRAGFDYGIGQVFKWIVTDDDPRQKPRDSTDPRQLILPL
ncbi:MAG: hypothetical protein AMS18_07090 [Gemmatimonas sp. SG8_17]|nr:MAG: hypothetical protein AMS18_07090 [Gemmatimonas sp. SG8_17]